MLRTMTRAVAFVASAALLALALGGCTKPPTDLLKKLKETLDGLTLAKKCAPEAYRSAMKMYEEAEELNKKKLYKEAQQAAETALKLAEKARELAEANRKDCEKIAQADEIGKKPAETPEPLPGTGEKPPELPGGPPTGPVVEKVVVYFDFNKFDVRPDAAQILTQFAGGLKGRTDINLEVEGHCDARGSVEYNLALGERRARAARDFLVAQGLPDKSISIISYGSERPAVDGATEDAYAKNRRAVVNRR